MKDFYNFHWEISLAVGEELNEIIPPKKLITSIISKQAEQELTHINFFIVDSNNFTIYNRLGLNLIDIPIRISIGILKALDNKGFSANVKVDFNHINYPINYSHYKEVYYDDSICVYEPRISLENKIKITDSNLEITDKSTQNYLEDFHRYKLLEKHTNGYYSINWQDYRNL